MALLIDHTQLTAPELAHLFPLRLLQMDRLSAERVLSRTVFFLYGHFLGGWAVGSVQGNTKSGVLEPGTLQHLSRDAQTDKAGALALFDAVLTQQLGPAMGLAGQLCGTELQSLPREVELRLAQNWMPAAPDPNEPAQRGLPVERLAVELRKVMGPLTLSPEWRELTTWLRGLPSPVAGQPTLVSPEEAKVWAYLLTEAAVSQQDGVPDALLVLQQEGAEAFCSLLDQRSLGLMARWISRSRDNLDVALPRQTVADLVNGSLALHARLLLRHWNARPSGRVTRTSVFRQGLASQLPPVLGVAFSSAALSALSAIQLTSVYRNAPLAKPAPGTVPSMHRLPGGPRAEIFPGINILGEGAPAR